VRAFAAVCLGLMLAGAECNPGVTCADKGGTCTEASSCPSGTETPTLAEIQAAGNDSTAYSCPAQGAVDAGRDVPICCLKIPVTN